MIVIDNVENGHSSVHLFWCDDCDQSFNQLIVQKTYSIG